MALFLLFPIFVSCGSNETPGNDNPKVSKEKTDSEASYLEMEYEQLADSLLVWFDKSDFRSTRLIAQAVHTDKGVRFSPYSFINTDSDIVLSGDYIRSVGFMDKRKWGEYDGSGNEIFLNGTEYFRKFIADDDYLTKGLKLVNSSKGSGNVTDNLKEVYPNCQFVEYYINGTSENENMDWKSLRLVFEKEEGNWKLVGIIHGQWTI